jgi:hypothetical protein
MSTATETPEVEATENKVEERIAHFLFPSDTTKAVFSLSSDGIFVTAVVPPAERVLRLGYKDDVLPLRKAQSHFEDIKCKTCNYYKDSLSLLQNLVSEAPQFLDRAVDEIENALKVKAATEDNCLGIQSYWQTAERNCKAGFKIEHLTTLRTTVTVSVPTLAVSKDVVLEEGSIESFEDIIELLCIGGDEDYDTEDIRIRYRLNRVWELSDRTLVKAYRLCNVYGDADICWGDNDVPKDLRSALNLFWASKVNRDLMDDERGDTSSLKASLKTYECEPVGRCGIEKIHLKYKRATPNPCVGLVITNAKSFLDVVPKKNQVRWGSVPPFVLGWVLKRKGDKALIDCCGFVVTASSLTTTAEVIPVELKPTTDEVKKDEV